MINFAVDDLDAFVKRLEGKGVTIIKRDQDATGKFASILGPDGTKIELWQPRPGIKSAQRSELFGLATRRNLVRFRNIDVSGGLSSFTVIGAWMMVVGMKAWRIHGFGGSDVLTLDDIERPEPTNGDVLVKVAATSVNPVDYKTREGAFPPVTLDDLPKTLGRDVAGTVEVAGDGFAVGDRVYGMPDHDRGSYAQYIVMKPGELAALPGGVDTATAGSVPLAALTAWQGLFDHGSLAKDERVLILGGAGGVGHLAVQFAIQAGATVFATGRANDIAFLERLGVARAIDTEKEDLSIIGEPVDLIYDLIGGDAQEKAWAAIADDGRFVSTLTEPDAAKAGDPGVRTIHYMARPDGSALSRIAAMIADGAVKVTIAKTFSFDEMPAAQDALEHGGVHGKIAVSID